MGKVIVQLSEHKIARIEFLMRCPYISLQFLDLKIFYFCLMIFNEFIIEKFNDSKKYQVPPTSLLRTPEGHYWDLLLLKSMTSPMSWEQRFIITFSWPDPWSRGRPSTLSLPLNQESYRKKAKTNLSRQEIWLKKIFKCEKNTKSKNKNEFKEIDTPA